MGIENNKLLSFASNNIPCDLYTPSISVSKDVIITKIVNMMYVKLTFAKPSANIFAYEPMLNIKTTAKNIGKIILLILDLFFDFILNKLISCDIVAFNKDINFFIFILTPFIAIIFRTSLRLILGKLSLMIHHL